LVTLAPDRRQGRWLIPFAIVSIVLFSWGLVRLIGSAWSACLDIEAGGGFALVFVYLPLTMLAVTAVAGAIAFGTSRLQIAVRGTLVVLGVCVTSLIIIAITVPYGGESAWTSERIASSDEATRQCGSGGVPTWWPAWLPH
jgi:hypothetical protein